MQQPNQENTSNNAKSATSKEETLAIEVRSLKNQLKGMEELFNQNQALEKEVKKLSTELDTMSTGILKNGYLYKWRETEIYYASRWGLRYFVLHRNQLSYYSDENEHRPRRTIDLSKCCIKEEGTKKNGLYNVFSIYLSDDSSDDGLVLRLSSDQAADANQWIDMLEKACAINAEDEGKKDASKVPKSITKLPISSENKESSSLPVHKRNLAGKEAPPGTADTASGEKLPASASADIPKGSKEKQPLKPFPGYKPMHITNTPSPLSTETRAGEYNYRGFFNLMIIILGLTHCDLIVNNISKYGFKFNLISFIRLPESMIDLTDIRYETSSILIHFAKAILTWVISIFLNYSMESYAGKYPVNEKLMLFFNFIIGTFNIVVPCYWVWTSKAHPGLNSVYVFQSVIIWMKLISYAHANKDLRVASRKLKKLDGEVKSGYSSGEELAIAADKNAKPFTGEQYVSAISEVKDLESPFLIYPQNITLKNLGYFLIIPTLCYQLNYPRTAKIKWDKLFLIVFRLIVVAFAMVFAIEQYIKPTLETAIAPMSRGDILGIAERLLKLSIPNTYVWLLGFYLFFHLWLNFLAEITRFGDRLFYKDWWNARTIDRYWKTWNIPVHNWVIRHLYYPILRMGCSRGVATFVVFFFSALMHELVISLPFQHIYFHAFLGMLAQAPLIVIAKFIDRRFDNAFLGNAFFWCTFCIVGQPMGVMMYSYDMYKLSNTGSFADTLFSFTSK